VGHADSGLPKRTQRHPCRGPGDVRSDGAEAGKSRATGGIMSINDDRRKLRREIEEKARHLQQNPNAPDRQEREEELGRLGRERIAMGPDESNR